MAVSKICKDRGQTTLVSNGYGTVKSLINCTGTVNYNQAAFWLLGDGSIMVVGRLNITNFVRTGANPGVKITLPDFIPTPTRGGTVSIGFRAQSVQELTNLTTTENSKDVNIFTTESFNNAQNGTLTLIMNSIIAIH